MSASSPKFLATGPFQGGLWDASQRPCVGPAPSTASPSLGVLSLVHQSPVSSLQSLLQPEPADSTRSSAYCPDYTVRALSDLQFIKVR